MATMAAILDFPIRTFLATFDLPVTPMLPTKFQVNWPFGSGEEVKNWFSRRPPWRPSWISDPKDFSFFIYWSPLILPTKFRVNWPFGSEEEVQNRFSRWPPLCPSWISNRNDFRYFWSTSHTNASYQVWSLGFLVQEKKWKIVVILKIYFSLLLLNKRPNDSKLGRKHQKLGRKHQELADQKKVKSFWFEIHDGSHGGHLQDLFFTSFPEPKGQLTQTWIESFEVICRSTRAVVGQRSSPAGYILYCNIFIIKKLKMYNNKHK